MNELSAPELAGRLAASFLPSNAARELFVALLSELARKQLAADGNACC